MRKGIAIIGAGRLARVILDGLKNRHYPGPVTVSTRDPENLKPLIEKYNIRAAHNNVDAVSGAAHVLFAVKPNVVEQVCLEIGPHIVDRAVIISMAAGVTTDKICEWTGNPFLPVIRVMSNASMAINKATCVLYSNSYVDTAQQRWVTNFLQQFGEVHRLSFELDINQYTPLIGAGPAFVYLFIEAMQKAAQEQGIPANLAQSLMLSVMEAAIEQAKNRDVEALRQEVTTPNGVTQSALQPLLNAEIFGLFAEGYKKGVERCLALGANSAGTSPFLSKQSLGN